MKKCPECGNLSYDGAPRCGNCGAKFPKKGKTNKTSIFKDSPKISTPKKEVKQTKKPKFVEVTKFDKENKDIIIEDTTIKENPKVEEKPIVPEKPIEETTIPKVNNEKSTLDIIKEKKLIIGLIILITIIVIAGIVISNQNSTNSSVNNTTQTNTIKFVTSGFSFSHPTSWTNVSGSDSEHPTSVFFKDKNGTTIQFYNITSSFKSLEDITKSRINLAQSNGDSVVTVDSLTIDERNASNIILKNSDGDYTRYVSLFTDGHLYVFKISGTSINAVNSVDINNAVASSHIG